MEYISHRQSRNDIEAGWRCFHGAAEKIHGDTKNPLPNPILINTDCAGELQNGVTAALVKPGQVRNRIMFHNVTLIILFWLEHKKKSTNKDGLSQVAMQAYRYFEILVPVGLHECRPHVCRATGDWVTSKDRLPEVKNLGKRFESMFRHVADRMTTLESVADAMSLLCYVIVLLRATRSSCQVLMKHRKCVSITVDWHGRVGQKK